ncbi:MAG: SIR2 family protein [Bifidobacteriales bacterium]|nr:SIR2 family protein [Bifidobacteriales bacterium]
MKGVSVNYNDIYEFNENNAKFTINTVVHMHGSIKGSSNNLVNSKESYDFIYRENSSVMKKLRNILNDPELLVIFIGSSIEQDILKLMTNDEFDHIDKISLLTYKSSNNESFDGKIVPYFYAKKHEDLRPFLHTLIDEIYSLSGINNTENYYKFRENSTSKEEIDAIFNQYDNPSRLFYGLNPEIEKKRIFQLTKLSKFFDGKIFVNQELWKLIIKYSYEFNDTQKNNIINHISNSTSSSFSYHAYICFIKMNPTEEQKDFLFEQLSKKDNINCSPFYINDDLMASWFLVHKIDPSNYYYEYSYFIEENRNYKIDSKLKNKILSGMCEDKKLQKSFYFESFCISRWGIIYKLLLEERIFLNNNLWIHDISKNHRNLQPIKGILKFYDVRCPFYTSEINISEIELASSQIMI